MGLGQGVAFWARRCTWLKNNHVRCELTMSAQVLAGLRGAEAREALQGLQAAAKVGHTQGPHNSLCSLVRARPALKPGSGQVWVGCWAAHVVKASCAWRGLALAGLGGAEARGALQGLQAAAEVGHAQLAVCLGARPGRLCIAFAVMPGRQVCRASAELVSALRSLCSPAQRVSGPVSCMHHWPGAGRAQAAVQPGVSCLMPFITQRYKCRLA